MNRRRFLKHAGATAGVVGASALGLDYLLTRPISPAQSTMSSVTTTLTPTIENLKWAPTRVQNGKVYDGNISFDVKNLNFPPSEVELAFTPVFPSEIPKAAIPSEDPRSDSLNPVGSTVSKIPSFSQDITEIKGGKQYSATAKVKDQASEVSGRLDIPYIRQFENIAHKDDSLVGAAYYLWYGKDGRHWDNIKGAPLLGKYDSGDPLVVSKHIDWATGYGIDFFDVSWWGPGSYEDNALRSLMKSPQANDVKFIVLYESLGRLTAEGPQFLQTINLDNPANVKVLGDDIEYIARNYFPFESYLKLDGKPVLYLWWSISYTGNVQDALSGIRKRVRDLGYDVYLIGDPVLFNEPTDTAITPYDAITQWTNYSWDTSILNNLEAQIKRTYSKWSSAARHQNVDFIPSALPGFQRVPNPEWPVLPKSPDRFRRQLEIAKQYLSEKTHTIMIPTFNDWHEYTYVEPSIDDGFTYLDVLRNTLS